MADDVVVLADGRRVGWCAWGDPDAPAVVHCHGMPGSGVEVFLGRPALERLRPEVRLVGLDRPGYGRSSPVARPGYAGWGADLDEVATRLGLGRFGLLGFSGGAPWALAAALELPERVTRVGLVAGLAPPGSPGMAATGAMAPDGRAPLRRALGYATVHLRTRFGGAGGLARRSLAGFSPADRVAMAAPDAAALQAAILRDGFARWGRAHAHEADRARRLWDVDPTRVTRPVHLWHGEDDPIVPAEVSRRFAEQIPGAACTTWPGHGHLSWWPSDHLGEVLDDLTRPAPPASRPA